MKKKLIITLCAAVPVAVLAAFFCRRSQKTISAQ